MADTLGQPLAEALVKIRFIYDKGESTRQVTNAVNDQTRIYKNQLGSLRREARAFTTIGTQMNKVGTALMLASGLGAGGLVWKGLQKYLHTTDKGAIALSMSMTGLRKSWDQFLARIGKAISQSGALKSIIESLKKFLDGLSTQKIMQFLDRAKWMFILGVLIKAVGLIEIAIGKILRTYAVLKGAGFLGAGMAGAGAVSGTGGGKGVITGGGAAGSGLLMAQFIGAIRSFSYVMYIMIKDLKHAYSVGGFKYLFMSLKNTFNKIEFFSRLYSDMVRLAAMKPPRDIGGRFASAKYVRGVAAETGAGSAGAEWMGAGKAMAMFKVIGEFLAKLAKILIVFDALAALFNGMGAKFSGGLGLIWKSIMFLVNAIDWIISIFVAGFEKLGNIIRFLNPFNDWTLEKAAKRQEEINEEVKAKRPWGYGDKKNEKFTFTKKIGTTSFAGLNKAAQDMITADNTSATKDNTEATRANTTAMGNLKNNASNLGSSLGAGAASLFKNANGWLPNVNSYSVTQY